jgi:hypothetical protein
VAVSNDDEYIQIKLQGKHAHAFLMMLLKEKRNEQTYNQSQEGNFDMSNSTMQVLEFWRWKRMEIDAEIAKHPERQDLHIWRSQITVRIEQLQKQVYKEEEEKRA